MKSIVYTTSAGTEITISNPASPLSVDVLESAIILLDNLEEKETTTGSLFDTPVHVPLRSISGNIVLDLTGNMYQPETDPESDKLAEITKLKNPYMDGQDAELAKTLGVPYGQCQSCGDVHFWPEVYEDQDQDQVQNTEN